MELSEAQVRALVENIPTLCWVANPDGYIVWYNRHWYEYTGTTPADMEGWGWQSVHDPIQLPHVMQRWQACIASGEPFEMVFPLRAADGSFRPFLTRISPHRDGDGRISNWFGVNTDISEQAKAEQAHRDSEANFRVLADSMPQMVWSTLPDGFHDYYNARWYEFTGMPAGSTDGEGWNGVFHPEDQERAWARWRHSLATGEPYEIEYRLRHHSGVYRWTLGRALALRGPDGAITRWFGTCTDIDDAKQLDEERELVANELSHRIKNIFSVISGLIHLSTRAFPEARPFALALRERISALGRAHDFVRPHSVNSRRQGGATTLFTMLGDLFAPYQDQDRITLAGEDPAVDDRSATSFGLLFHELATNATKYGALSVDAGHVLVSTAIKGDALTIIWRESSGPSVVEPARVGFGSTLARLSVEGQLGGSLAYAWDSAGLVVTVMVPMAVLRRARAGSF